MRVNTQTTKMGFRPPSLVCRVKAGNDDRFARATNALPIPGEQHIREAVIAKARHRQYHGLPNSDASQPSRDVTRRSVQPPVRTCNAGSVRTPLHLPR
jgi:hypothetical protein